MAEQNLHQIRPFMAKQTFDQVSAMMWGQGALDYHTNYIVPRAQWDDSDVREEALYFAGLAHGLRVGVSQKSRQPMMHQDSCKDQNSVPVNVNSDQTGSSNAAHLAPAKHGSFSAAFQSQVAPNSGPSHRRGVAPPSHTAPSNKLPPSLPHYEPFRFGTPYQRASTTAVKGADLEIEEPFGVLSAPDGTTLTIPIADNQASKVVIHSPTSQLSVATRKDQNIMDPLFKNISESSFDENYHDVYTPPTLEEDSDEEGYHEDMERWFDEQADAMPCGNR